MIHLTINDTAYEAEEGWSILEVCRDVGIHVPTLCYHPALEPYGACRLCMVEVSMPPRPPKLAASCVTPCAEGMVVQTDTERVRRSRRMTAELLLAESYNNPEMLALANELGVRQVRFKLPDQNPCVLCGLCVRACREIVGVSAISLIERGIEKKVSPPFEIASGACIGCGTCVLICPTGVLTLEDVGGYRSAHGDMPGYEKIYCRVCADAPPEAAQVDEIAGLLFKKPGTGQERV